MMSSTESVESTKSYSFKRYIKKTKNTIEERWIKRIHCYHHRLFEYLIQNIYSFCLLGIEPTGNHVDAPAKFHVETFAAGKGNVDVIVINPKGQLEKVKQKK